MDSKNGSRIAYERKALSDSTIGKDTEPLTPTIWLLDPHSGDTAPLFADPPLPGRHPVWSPSRQRLAFYDLTEGAVQIYDWNTGQQQFFDTLADVGTWDPEGKQMILPDVSFHNEQSADYLVRIDDTTRQVQDLSTSDSIDDTMPRWSPTGKWIAYGRSALSDPKPELWVVSLTDRQPVQIATGAIMPDWLP